MVGNKRQPSGAIRILIADDHDLIRHGLRLFLQSQPGFEVVGEAGDGCATLQLADGVEWDVLLLDIYFPGEDGLDVLRRIKSRFPDRGVLILSMYSEQTHGVHAVRAGADGYLPKGARPEELLRAIEGIARHEKYIGRDLAARLAMLVREERSRWDHERLSEREFQVLRMLAAGVCVTEIARALHLSSKTVSTYRRRVMQKMDFAHEAQLVQYALRHGLVPEATLPEEPESA